jgi:phage baseplate assembly protein W
MTGMDAATGRPLGDLAHLRQSIARILSTPVGSRIARRDFGSLLPDLVDQPMNAIGRMRLLAATAQALLRWEPRLRITSVTLEPVDPTAGQYALAIEGVRLDVPAPAAASTTSALTRFSVPLASLTRI